MAVAARRSATLSQSEATERNFTLYTLNSTLYTLNYSLSEHFALSWKSFDESL
jgi:hypothetical protein